ncbi:hypothetical protein OK074_7025 [Actinobacteria bacterium OK074]|nr:hypothetical protein OK074_7025 [Actinobacteria bacterium OK074]
MQFKVQSTDEVVEALRAALAGVGVQLPSLGVDPVSFASSDKFALVSLGRCNVGVAMQLAAALRGETPRVGTYGLDVREGKVGEIMGHVGGLVQLRPVGGGVEWDCPVESVEAAPPKEVLRAKVRKANQDGRLP